MEGRLTILLISVTCLAAAEDRISYEGHRVFRAVPRTQRHLESLANITELYKVDVWKHPSALHQPADFCVCREMRDDFARHLEDLALDYFILIPNVQPLIDRQVREHESADREKRDTDGFDYKSYHRLDEINEWMRNLEASHSMVSLQNIGKSTEQRDMTVLSIRSATTTTTIKRPAFYVQSGIHAREWISVATAMYIVGEMLERYNTDANITRMVDSFDWYFLPVVNPDGYEFTWTSDRLWRKTRSRQGDYYGVDPNRNWDTHWGGVGSGSSEKGVIFKGPSPFSEPEVQSVKTFLEGLKDVKGFIDFHAYGQLWMSPWGYTTNLPEDFEAQNRGSAAAVSALEAVHGTKQKYGSVANTVYTASGIVLDWVYAALGVKYSYTPELRDTGQHGFILPAAQIIPTGEETLAALIALAEYVASN